MYINTFGSVGNCRTSWSKGLRKLIPGSISTPLIGVITSPFYKAIYRGWMYTLGKLTWNPKLGRFGRWFYFSVGWFRGTKEKLTHTHFVEPEDIDFWKRLLLNIIKSSALGSTSKLWGCVVDLLKRYIAEINVWESFSLNCSHSKTKGKHSNTFRSF